jgi:hypothetical protein
MTGAIKAVRKYEKAAKRKVKKPNRDLSDVEEAPEETIRSLRHPCYSFSHRIVKTGSLGFFNVGRWIAHREVKTKQNAERMQQVIADEQLIERG